MPSVRKWSEFAYNEAKKSRAYNNFYQAKKANPKTLATYAFCFEKFMDFVRRTGTLDYDQLAGLDSDRITDIIREYTYEINDTMKGNSVQNYINPVRLFFGMNNKMPNPYILTNAVKKDDSIPGGGIAATDEDIRNLLSVTVRPLEVALVHFLASTGVRPGALMDPVLRIRHLGQMPDGCKSIKVYDNSKEGYWAFLTPEAAAALQRYLNSRRNNGEELNDDSAVFRPHTNSKHESLTCNTARDIVSKLIRRSGIIRTKSGNRFDKAVMYMFRKRFNGKLKMENSVNSNIAEKLMAHKRGLDGTYLAPTKEECFEEFRKAVPALTIDPTRRQKIKIQTQERRILELEEKNNVIASLQDKVRMLEERWMSDHFHEVIPAK